jgi:Zn-dependent peptidase ImmA (M78 family)/DNA-binding XRE family transcriptional regulator
MMSMSTPVSFNPSRLKAARERRGLTKDALATLCGVSRRAVTDWENGKVDAPPVARISIALGFPKEFFSLDDVDEVPSDAVSFRAVTSMTQRQLHKVLSNAIMLREFARWMEDRFRTPAVDVPSAEDFAASESPLEPSPVDTAAALRALWNLGAQPIKNLLNLLEGRGVLVFGLADDDQDVDAFSFWQGGRPYIFVNASKSAERIRFDLAHELGHLVMHRGLATARNRRYELDANSFASAFLIPADGLLPQIVSRPSLTDVMTLKKYWRVSAAAMAYRLHKLGRVTDWQYRSWMVDLTQRGFRTDEPDGLPREQSSLLRQVLALARADGWTLDRISAHLGIPAADLTAAFLGLTPTALPGSGEPDADPTPAVRRHLRPV